MNRTLERLPARPFPASAYLNQFYISMTWWSVSISATRGAGSSLRDGRSRSPLDETSVRVVALMSLQHCLPGQGYLDSQPLAGRARGIRTLAAKASCRRSNGVMELILAGHIFQANIAQCFSATVAPLFDPLTFYCQLRSSNPAPFGALLRYGKLTIASSSPERFLKLDGQQVETRPIKGTIARSADGEEDRRRAKVLLASEKDRAENVMMVDLLRNDLSRVCTDNSGDVMALCNSASPRLVSGTLAAGQDAVSLLRACFPGGSVTGVPKVRSIEIIADLEKVAREVYCGAIGFVGFSGQIDTNIAIRTVTIDGDLTMFHAGGGITAMSTPEAEYEKTLAKAQRLFDAFDSEIPGAS